MQEGRALCAALLARDRPGVRDEVAEAWTWLARYHGAGTVRGLAAHVALSERRLTTLFRAETGLTPKQAARLMRFERAKRRVVAAVSARERLDLARVAADCGYYDHSHLVRDFRQYTGVSPTAWLAEECRNIQAGGHRNGPEWDA
ncbi:helix-turn-helix domain-containing protein [Streptomyces sp. NPDC002851]